jgi:hypothetical protein
VNRRLAAVVVTAVVAVLAVVAVAVLYVTTRGHRPPLPPPVAVPSRPPGAAAPPSIATSTGPFAAGPVAPPATGSYLGAWVKPDQLTQTGRLDAVKALEKQLGRKLDIVNTYRRFDENFFESSDQTLSARGSTLMLSWASGDTRSITAGDDDALIKEHALELRQFGKPVLLRFRWEMDRPNLQASMWSAADYIAAWKYVRALFAKEGATNASWVWCPTAEGFAGNYAQQFYPGDDQVDWVCEDVYAGATYTSIGDLSTNFLTFSAQHPSKPAMIGEFGVARAWGTAQRAAWLADAARTFEANPQIRAVLYFESDPNDNKGPTQQFQLSDDPAALAAFRSLARAPYFNPMRR